MSVCHGKRNSYSTDFKLKVLEFYLKNGGENVFGLKSRTAEHFNIGKKTVVRIVESKDALMRAKNSKSKKSVDSVTKSASTSKVTGHTKKVHSAGGSGKGNITAVKSVSSQGSKTLVLSVKTPNKVGSKGVASKKESKKEVAAAESAPVKSSSATPRVSEEHNKSTDVRGEHEEVLELPEDPDYAILKIPIDGGTTATGVAGPALLLSTATDEVRRALVYECEVLYECKVCRSLFRSVVNFLAHKRIFCTLSHNSEKTFDHEGESSHLTPHSSTVITSASPASGGSARVSTRKCHQASASSTNSSATDVGSSAYFARLERVERKRAAASEDCKVVLESAGEGVNNAVYQTFQHPDAPAVQPSLQDARLTVREHERGVMAVLGKDGRIVSTVGLDHQNLADLPCSDEASVQITSVADLVDVKEEPINLDDNEENEEEQASSVVVAAEQLSKASCEEFETTKPEIEQHHQAVKNNSRKGKDSSRSSDGDGVEGASPSFSDVVVKTEANDAVSTGSSLRSKEEGRASRQSSLLRCPDCSMFFISQRSLEAHKNFYCHSSETSPFISRRASIEAVQRRPLPLHAPSDSPAKKIGIQIRKVYKTENESQGLPAPVKPKVKSSSGRSLSLPDIFNGRDSQTARPVHTFDYPNSKGPFTGAFLLKKIASFCSFKKLRCFICRRTFSNGSSLRKHAAIHLSWTRFLCSVCGFRDYQECRLVKHLADYHGVQSQHAASSYVERHFINEPFRAGVIAASSGDLGTPGVSLKTNKRSLESIACIENVPPKKFCAEESRVAHLKLMDDTSCGKQILTLKLKRVQLDVAPKKNSPSPNIGSKTKSLESIIKNISFSSKLASTETNGSDKSANDLEASPDNVHCSGNESSKSDGNLSASMQKPSLNSDLPETDGSGACGTAVMGKATSQRPRDAVENAAPTRSPRRRKTSPKKLTVGVSESIGDSPKKLIVSVSELTGNSPKKPPSSIPTKARKDESTITCQRKSPDKKNKAVTNSKLVVSVASLTKKSRHCL